MKNPKTQAAFSRVRERWEGMSDEQRGEQLIELISLKCSVRGIADDLGAKESNLRRYIGSAKTTGTNRGWIASMERTLAKGPTQRTKSARQVADCKPSETPAKKGALSIIKETCPVKDEVHSSTTQPKKGITSPSSTRAQERLVVNPASGDKESRPGEYKPKTNLVDLYMSIGQRELDKIQRLAAIADSIPTRPVRDATSIPRQGRPPRPSDPD